MSATVFATPRPTKRKTRAAPTILSGDKYRKRPIRTGGYRQTLRSKRGRIVRIKPCRDGGAVRTREADKRQMRDDRGRRRRNGRGAPSDLLTRKQLLGSQ